MNKNVLPLTKNTLKLSPSGLKSRKYAVSIKYFDGDNNTPSKRIDYEIEIAITPNQGNYLLDIFKNNIWFDQHEPDLINEIIANELSKSLYPVQVKIDEDDMSLNGVANYKQILSRWYGNKHKLTEKYNTPATRSFYQAFEKNLESRAILERSMQYDWFWNLLFHPKYINYGNEHIVETDLYLAVVPYEYPVQFKGKQKINTGITNYNSVEIHFESDEINASSYFIPKNRKSNLSENPVLMRLNVYHDLDVYHLFPMHIRAYFEVFTKDSQGDETLLKKIQFTQYQQGTETNKTSPKEKRSPFEVYEDDHKEVYKTYEGKNYTFQEWKKFEDEQYEIYKKKRNKKGFWDFLG